MVQGPLLDFGRNPLFFACAWIYRQGILTPWTRNRSLILRVSCLDAYATL